MLGARMGRKMSVNVRVLDHLAENELVLLAGRHSSQLPPPPFRKRSAHGPVVPTLTVPFTVSV